MPIRVLIADDSALLRDALARAVDAADDLELVATASDLAQATALAHDRRPDVVLTDIRMPPTGTDEGIRLADHLRREQPETGVVVLSQYAEAAYALDLFAAGAEGRGYLLKERVADLDELLAAVREVAAGGSVTDPKVVEQLVSANRGPRATALDRLTPRELEVLGHMAQGRSNAAIASTLVLSERAVEKHSNAIFSKLGLTEERDANRRVRAVLVYLQEGGGG